MHRILFSAVSGLALGALPLSVLPLSAAEAPAKAEVLGTYVEIAAAAYVDSHTAAERLAEAVGALVRAPSPEALHAARTAWRAARVPYAQTEVFRFGNPIVDDWEGQVNSWPLDEGLIDYTDADYGATDENDYAALNVVATPAFTLSGQKIDAGTITPALLRDTLQEADGVETNVATGYHAIEFLLWGQDLNGTGPGAGMRPWTDYAAGDACTNGNCDRRGAYLEAATGLLVSDLREMATAWATGGKARAAVLADEDAGIAAMLAGMGSLSYGELAGERMKLGVMLNDPEEEQDCFSDNTANSHYYDGLGIENVYLGAYAGIDGRLVAGPSLSELVAAADPEVDAELREALSLTMLLLGRIKTVDEAGTSYDQLLAIGNADGEALVMGAVEALVGQTRAIERAMVATGAVTAGFEGSNSLDNPGAVFQ